MPPPGGYDFSIDWFSKHRPIWDQLLEQLRPARMLEIGCYEGFATCYLIDACAAQRDVELHCIDTWQGGVEHAGEAMDQVEARFDRNVALARKNARHAVRLHKHKDRSSRALAALLGSQDPCSFDLAYVDGSHQAPDVLADAVMAFQLLRIGGVMVFDDYLWHLESHGAQDPLNMPKPGIDAFVNIFQRKLRVLPDLALYQLYVEKLAD